MLETTVNGKDRSSPAASASSGVAPGTAVAAVPATAQVALTAEEYCRQGDALLAGSRHEEAAHAYQLALLVDDDCRPAVLGYNRAVRRIVPRWHFAMMNDAERNALFEEAIAKLVPPGSLVLDIGTGGGLLALMAARHGAARVVSCECVPVVAEVARRIVRQTGHGDRIDVVTSMSTQLRVGAELERRADVLITEIVDCGLLGEGILASVAHAREHLLADDAVILPRAGRVVAQLVESAELHRLNHVGSVGGFDLSEFNRLSSCEYFSTSLRKYQHQSLSEPFEVFAFDFTRDGPVGQRRTVEVTATHAGSAHALVFWFEMELAPGLVLCNAPSRPDSHWQQAIQCLPRPVAVEPGRPVRLEVSHDGRRVLFERISPQGAAEVPCVGWRTGGR